MHLSHQLVIDDRSKTLSFASEFNTICLILSSNDALLLIVNETDRGYLYNVKCRRLIGIHRFEHDVCTIKFSLDSNVLAVISGDMITKIFSVSLLDKLHRFILVSHVCEIVGAFFEQDSLNIMTICKNGKVNYWTADMDLASMELIPYIPSENDN
ncbi:unnamed protein product [Rotaria sordida]|uniref:Uncharacterized protein n=1 Tax=Rotaria sordida TaxID=392033 RepID=A0A815BBW6_9BILA|nr:unnamed protein product [Rotaria sordida]CAF1271817.1 unnamed protein product [Rotaria sordida]CAF1350620.1 unnamed protein product [Rotaria sordida]CAF1551027.1 unnamed protein product [Rotaria sordida]CAF3817253.1 unnamed protein product [Rotaria sordida]